MNCYRRRFLSLEEKISSRLTPPNERGCRLWLGRKFKGYGTIKIAGKWRRVSRTLWELHRGPIPEDMFVLHSCDNPPCCEEEHFFLGDHQANSDDKVSKNRQARGHKTLNEDGARLVLRLRDDGWSMAKIGREVGVTAQAVCAIIHKKNWAHIQRGITS